MDDHSEPLEPQAAAVLEEPPATGERGLLLSAKDGDVFLVADAQGDISGGADGLFADDTRILSRYRLLVGDKQPSPLSFGVSPDSAVFTFHGTNLALPPMGHRATPRGVIHIERKRVLFEGRFHERVRCANFGLDEVMLPLAFEYAADFRDMFEVRGMVRHARGALAAPRANGRSITFSYLGLDGRERTSTLAFSEPPWRLSPSRAEFMFILAPGAHMDLFVEIGAGPDDPPARDRFLAALDGARHSVRERRDRGASVRTPTKDFQAWLDQSRADVALLTTDLPTGPYPYAGIPWFSTPFGRDGIITAWQMLWLDPSLAKGVLTYLAARQATELSAFRDSAPGKIMHETRRGEMAALGEIPFGQYYGGVDTTPLFVSLAGAYLQRTDDIDLIAGLWPALRRAAAWLDEHGDSNGDGLIDYARGAETGLSNQGWKDSEDSVFHQDGRFPATPIALAEVQGYAFAAWRAMASMANRLGEDGEAWARRAEAVREAVEDRFWMEEDGFYAIAVDGTGAPCRPHASNAGHLLFVGLPDADRAHRVTRRLLSAEFDSGWGVRTLAKGWVRFNPMSYHNGSIWPHDTALCLAGMARYGERDGVARILCDLFTASKHFQMRMPELFCGFAREEGEPPIAYPVACMPQAWAASSTFLMLQACLGLSIDAARLEVRLVRPTLPAGIDRLDVAGLEVGGRRVDLRFQRLEGSVAVTPGPDSDLGVAVVLEG